MRFLISTLLLLAGCSEPYNLVEEEYFEQLDSEIEQRAKVHMVEEALDATIVQQRFSLDHEANLVEVHLGENIPASLWGSLLQGAGLLTADFSQVPRVHFDPNVSKPDSSSIGGVGLVGENLYGGDATDFDLLYTKRSDRSSGRSHPVELSWWSEVSPWDRLKVKKEQSYEYPAMADSIE